MKPMINILLIGVCLVIAFAVGIFITNGVSYAPVPQPTPTFIRR